MEDVAGGGLRRDRTAGRQRRYTGRRHRERERAADPAPGHVRRARDGPRDHSDRVDRAPAIFEARDAERAGEPPTSVGGARQRNDERGRALGGGDRGESHGRDEHDKAEQRGYESHAAPSCERSVLARQNTPTPSADAADERASGVPASWNAPSRIMAPRDAPARPGPGTDELRRRRLLAVPAPLEVGVAIVRQSPGQAVRVRHEGP